MNTILNLEDNSYLVMGSLSSSIIENSLIGFNVTWAHGKDYSEFNNLPYDVKLELSFSIGF